jgi:hypothetical protein
MKLRAILNFETHEKGRIYERDFSTGEYLGIALIKLYDEHKLSYEDLENMPVTKDIVVVDIPNYILELQKMVGENKNISNNHFTQYNYIVDYLEESWVIKRIKRLSNKKLFIDNIISPNRKFEHLVYEHINTLNSPDYNEALGSIISMMHSKVTDIEIYKETLRKLYTLHDDNIDKAVEITCKAFDMVEDKWKKLLLLGGSTYPEMGSILDRNLEKQLLNPLYIDYVLAKIVADRELSKITF